MRWIPTVLAVACASCMDQQPAQLSRAAYPVKTACTASARPAASEGFEVRPGRRHSEAQTVFVTNIGSEPRDVQVQQVSRVEGACSSDWARQTPLNFVDAATRSRPAPMTVAPGQTIRVEIGAQRVHGTWDCTKVGLALWMRVDDGVVCADAGAWISEAGNDA